MSTTYKYDDELLRANGLKLVDGKLSSGDQYIYDKAKIQKQIAGAEKEASRAVAQTRAAAQISPEMEQANILWEKTKKYMPTMMKQAGLSGLGVAQSTMLQAQNDHLNRMNALKRERDEAIGAATALTVEDYRRYIEELEGESADLDLTKAKTDIEGVYGENGWSNAQREAELGKILGRFGGSPEVQNSLLEYAKSYQADSAAMDEFYKLYGTKGGMTAAEYLAAARELDNGGAAEEDFWETNEAEKILEWYNAQSEGVQVTVDDYLEAIGAMSVEDKAAELTKEDEEMAKADEAVAEQLLIYGAGYDENGSLVLDNVPLERIESILSDESVQMSATLRESLEGFAKVGKGRREEELKALFEATSPDGEALDAEGVKEYIAQLIALEEAKNRGEISEKFYNEHVVPEIDEFAKWKKFLDEEAATHNKQMAGERPVKVDGKKWFVANAPEGDVEAFMDAHEEAVDRAISELGYGNAKNPNIPNNTVIKIEGARLMYDSASEAWRYVTEKVPNNRFAYQSPSGEFHYNDYYVVNGQEKRIYEVENEKILNSINEVELGEKAKDGKVLTVKIDGKAREFVLFKGKWYHTSYAQWYKFE